MNALIPPSSPPAWTIDQIRLDIRESIMPPLHPRSMTCPLLRCQEVPVVRETAWTVSVRKHHFIRPEHVDAHIECEILPQAPARLSPVSSRTFSQKQHIATTGLMVPSFLLHLTVGIPHTPSGSQGQRNARPSFTSFRGATRGTSDPMARPCGFFRFPHCGS